jgi:uncharacterized membrane protein
MNTRTTIVISSLLILAALVSGALLWNRLPEQVASHWNAYDQVDGYTTRLWGVLLMPLISLGMLLLFVAVPNIDPLKANIAKFRPVFNVFILFIIAFMLYLYALTMLWSLGFQGFRMSRALLPVIGILFIFVGWMLRSAKRNFFIGIRTPWTLSSDRVWDQTHRLGSVLFMVCGAIAVIGAFFGGMTSFWLMFVPLMGTALFLVVYSYVLYQRETHA